VSRDEGTRSARRRRAATLDTCLVQDHSLHPGRRSRDVVVDPPRDAERRTEGSGYLLTTGGLYELGGPSFIPAHMPDSFAIGLALR
jgi:hypothetical protein